MDRFIECKLVGEGAFGKVYNAREHSSRRIRAIKETDLDESAMTELNALISLENHPNIVEYIRYFFEKEKLCLVMEYCSGGTLNASLVSHPQPEPSRDLRFMREIASAVAFLHRNGIVHRDLKPDNILLSASGILKVADFGLAKIFTESQHGGSLYKYYTHSQGGTRFFMAPEVLKKRYTEKADVFQMGVVFACILERNILVVNSTPISAVYVKNSKGEIKGISEALREGMLPKGYKLSESCRVGKYIRKLVEVMLDATFKVRPSAEDVYESLVRRPTTETPTGPSQQTNRPMVGESTSRTGLSDFAKELDECAQATFEIMGLVMIELITWFRRRRN